MELTLPMNYVELEQDEMMYLDGGWKFTGIYNGVVAFGINAVFNGFMGGGTVGFVKKVLSATSIKNGFRKYIGKFLSAQATNRVIGLIFGGLFGFLSWSIGSAAAKLWDKFDTSPNNGICGTPNWF